MAKQWSVSLNENEDALTVHDWHENDILRAWRGHPGSKRLQRWTDRVTRHIIRETNNYATRLGIPVDLITDTRKVPDGHQGEKAWYDPDTDTVHIVLPEHHAFSTTDVLSSLWGEGVVRHGLRATHGEKLNDFLNGIFYNTIREVGEAIDDIAEQKGITRAEATEEYLVRTAESLPFHYYKDGLTPNKIADGWREPPMDEVYDEIASRPVTYMADKPLTDASLTYIPYRLYRDLQASAAQSTTNVDHTATLSRSHAADSHINFSLPTENRQVYTDNFKRWFGDWERNFQKDYLLYGDPVSHLKGEKIIAKPGQTFVQAVEELFNKQGGKANSPFGEVLLDHKGVKNDVHHGMGTAKNIAFASVKDVLENGVVVLPLGQYGVHGKKEITGMVAAPIEIDGTRHICIVEVIANKEKQRLYVHEAFTEENIPDVAASNLVPGGKTASPQRRGEIAKLLQEILTAKNSSKIVDENGQPLIVYHGTDENFTIFRTHSETGVRNRYDELPSEYFNFTDNKSAASDYGETMAVYLDIKNPLRADTKEAVANIIRSEIDYINKSQTVRMLDEENVDEFIDNFVGEDGRLFSETRDETEAEHLWPVIQNAIADYAARNGYDGFIFNDPNAPSINPSRVINDIAHYYEDGIKPQSTPQVLHKSEF